MVAQVYMMLLSLMISDLMMQKYDYQNNMSFIIRSAAKVFECAFDQQLRKKADITVAQSRVIGTLVLLKDGMTQKEIANRIGIEAPTIVPIIDRLEAQGIVKRKSDPNDRRNNLIFLTSRSEAIWKSIIECAVELEQSSRQGVSEEDLEITKSTLRKIAQNVSSLQTRAELDQIKGDRQKNSNTIRVRKQQPLQLGMKKRL